MAACGCPPRVTSWFKEHYLPSSTIVTTTPLPLYPAFQASKTFISKPAFLVLRRCHCLGKSGSLMLNCSDRRARVSPAFGGTSAATFAYGNVRLLRERACWCADHNTAGCASNPADSAACAVALCPRRERWLSETGSSEPWVNSKL